MKIRSNGFTLIEMLVTLVILAVLLAIAAPSYRAFILDARMGAEANEFLTALNFARSEAVKRNGRVSVCKSGNGTACDETTDGSWAQGWIVFVDVATGTAGVFDDADTILRVHAALTTDSTVTADAAVADYASFAPDGRSLLANGAAQAGNFDLCVANVAAPGRRVGLALGRSQVTTISPCPLPG